MKVTIEHYRFLCAARNKSSTIFKNLKSLEREMSVHRLIPTTWSTDKDFVIQNVLANLKSARKRGEMIKYLQQYSLKYCSTLRPERVQASCKKWLRRIEQSIQGEKEANYDSQGYVTKLGK